MQLGRSAETSIAAARGERRKYSGSGEKRRRTGRSHSRRKPVVWGAFTYFNRSAERAQSPPSPMFKGNQPPPEPRLQGAPGHQSSGLDDMLEMRARENRILSSYGWVDQQSGVVHIPIEEAKKLMLERGMAEA